MNDKKICFIVCTNKDIFFDEMSYYISMLIIPEGFEIELLEIRDAVSMAAGYNEGMKASDAKYKIYMHQDVLILYFNFLQSIIDIFAVDSQIGMIGLVGSPVLPADGIMWHGNRVFAMQQEVPWKDYEYDLFGDNCWEVEAVDGLLIATQYDLDWRDDLFDGWDFYDISHAMEMHRHGYRVLVPCQRNWWYIHLDDRVISYWNYNHYRKKFLQEYIIDRKERIIKK